MLIKYQNHNILFFLIALFSCFNLYSQINCTHLHADAGEDSTICLGDNIQIGGSPTASFSGSNQPASYSYLWTPNVNISNNTLSNPYVSPTDTITYKVLVISTHNNGSICKDSSYITITVDSLPIVTLAPFADVCSNANPFQLSGGSPAGGTYSGTGVSSGWFNPSLANIGNNTITYTYTDGNGCTKSDTKTITVLQSPIPGTFMDINGNQQEEYLWDWNNPTPFTGCLNQ